MQIVINIPEEIYKASQIIDVKYNDVIQIPLEIIANGIVLPYNHGKLKDVDEIICKLQNHRGLFINAYNGNFSDMPKDYKARVDEISNCISAIINATTILDVEMEGKE